MIDDIINQEHTGQDMDQPVRRRVERVRHELKRRELAVLRTAQLSPHMRPITFGGEQLQGFTSASFDDHVKLILEDGAVMRDYTPRHYDPQAGELTIEFALHGDGPASRWAARAQPGERATIGGPRGSFIVPLDYEWHLLVGDASALPAIARRLEELPPTARAIVIAQIGPEDRRPFGSACNLQLTWVDTPRQMLDTVDALQLPPGEGYAWCAGEAAEMAALRRLLVDAKGHDRHAIRAAAYWKRGAAAHHENLE
jgi:NADPH-dependent ferric siderophore reductase